MILNVLWSPDNLCIARCWRATGGVVLGYQDRLKSSFAINTCWKPDEVGIGLLLSNDLVSQWTFYDFSQWWQAIGEVGYYYRETYAYLYKAYWYIKVLAWFARWGACRLLVVLIRGFIYGMRPVVTLSISIVVIEDTLMLFLGTRSKRIASAGATDLYICGMPLMAKSVGYTSHRPRSIHAISWSSDGTKIASAGDDGRIRIWDALNGQTLAIYEGTYRTSTLLAWSPNGGHLASASNDGTVRVWSIIFKRNWMVQCPYRSIPGCMYLLGELFFATVRTVGCMGMVFFLASYTVLPHIPETSSIF